MKKLKEILDNCEEIIDGTDVELNCLGCEYNIGEECVCKKHPRLYKIFKYLAKRNLI